MIICAEIGINHNGDINICHEMIRQASMAGADIVKFQLYDPEIVFATEPHLIEEGQRCQFNRDEFKRMVEWARHYNITPSCSVFDKTRLEWAKELDIPCYKIASRTIARDPGLTNTILSLGKPTYIAYGMSKPKRDLPQNAKRLFCVSKYPASHADYTNQPMLYDESLYYGISDHTLGIETSLIAAARGAQFIEKHFTLSKVMPGSDHICSITPDELSDLVKYSKLISKAIT